MHSTIAICLKLKKKVEISPTLVNLINDDSRVVFELSLLASNMEKEVLRLLESFLFFLKKYDTKKIHNMFLMLGPKFRSVWLISSYIVVKKVWLLLKNMIRDLYILCILNAIIIYINYSNCSLLNNLLAPMNRKSLWVESYIFLEDKKWTSKW